LLLSEFFRTLRRFGTSNLIRRFLRVRISRLILTISVFYCASLSSQQLGPPSELNGEPLFLRKTWVIGGEGKWGRMAIDPAAGRIYIPHTESLQIADAETGELIAQIKGFQKATDIVLDPDGERAYIADEKQDAVFLFNRRTLQIENKLTGLGNPSRLVYDAANELLFTFSTITHKDIEPRTAPARMANGSTVRRTGKAPAVPYSYASVLRLKDSWEMATSFRLPGLFRAAESDAHGTLYLALSPDETHPEAANIRRLRTAEVIRRSLLEMPSGNFNAEEEFRWRFPNPYIPLQSDCSSPSDLAIDQKLQRLFVACGNNVLTIWDAQRGQLTGRVSLSAPPESMAYLPEESRIYLASGAASGSLTVVRQHITDSYYATAVLPTLAGANRLIADPRSGRIYILGELTGIDLSSANGLGTLKTEPVANSFRILVISR
jgi:hypothetical protein